MSRNNTPRGLQLAENWPKLPRPCEKVDISTTTDEAPTLRPTLDEFADFEEFVKRARSNYHEYGLVKVIPPEGWAPRKKSLYEDVDAMTIPLAIKQVLQGKRGVYTQYNIEQKPMQVAEFREKAAKVQTDCKVAKLTPSERDRAYWRTVAFNPVLYGADMPGSLFDKDVEAWNLDKLPNLLNLLPTKLAGINDPYLYFGMWKAAFAWHVEDMDLYSINYLHFGEPKAWYSVPQREMGKFEQAAATLFPEESRSCKQFLRHKQSVISPSVLSGTFHIKINTVIQEAGQFVITWPGAYHAGFNHGFNCAEAVNFAVDDWIPWGRASKPCLCDAHRALINMDYFVYQYEVHKYGKPITNPDLDMTRFNSNFDPSLAPLPAHAWPNPKNVSSSPSPSKTKSTATDPIALDGTSPSLSSVPASTSNLNKPRSSPKKKNHIKFVTLIESAPRPQLIRPPEPGARVSPRFHPPTSSNSASSKDIKFSISSATDGQTKKRSCETPLSESLGPSKIPKLHELAFPAASLTSS